MEDFSLSLSGIFDRIGVSNAVRDRCRELSDAMSVINDVYTMLQTLPVNEYSVGSFPEGTHRRCLNSDYDTIQIYRNFPVKEKLQTKAGDEFYMYSDQETSTGYVKISIPDDYEKGNDILQKTPFQYDMCCGSRHLTNQLNMPFLEKFMKNKQTQIHGPAFKTMWTTINLDHDFVFGLECATWSNMALDWQKRAKTNQWLSPETVQLLTELPCFIVPTGSKGSLCERFEWRLSFNLQEQHIMFGLSETQYKCYMLLKYIKESFIRPFVGEDFTSYHCKTVLFYAIENTTRSIWCPERLIECFLKCVKLLVIWSQNGFCPNYFVPWCDLFKGKLNTNQLELLCNLLNDIYNYPFKFISNIELDSIGRLLTFPLTYEDRSIIETKLGVETARVLTARLTAVADELQEVVRRLLDNTYPPVSVRETSALIHESGCKLDVLQNAISRHIFNVNRILLLSKRYRQNMTKFDILDTVFRKLCTSLACHLVVLAIQQPRYKDWYIITAAMYFSHDFSGAIGDGTVNCKLKLANVLYMMGYKESARQILIEIEDDIKSVYCYLGADDRHNIDENDNIPFESFVNNSIHQIEFGLFCGPICFYPGETRITPDGLKLEMFRWVGTLPLKREKLWHAWAVVDARTFYRFLCWQTGIIKRSLLEYIRQELQTNIFTNAHIETKINLLAWVARDTGYNDLALDLCVESLVSLKDIQNFYRLDQHVEENCHEYNAAKIHLAILFYEILKNNGNLSC